MDFPYRQINIFIDLLFVCANHVPKKAPEVSEFELMGNGPPVSGQNFVSSPCGGSEDVCYEMYATCAVHFRTQLIKSYPVLTDRRLHYMIISRSE